MASINTNNAAMNALSTLRSINSDLNTTQSRIGTGLKITSAKDNAAYFSISESMKGDSGTFAAIDEGLTLTKNSISTARMGAETIKDLGKQFLDKIAFAQGAKGGLEQVQGDLLELVKQMETTLSQSTFNGDDMVAAGATLGIADAFEADGFTPKAAALGAEPGLAAATVGTDDALILADLGLPAGADVPAGPHFVQVATAASTGAAAAGTREVVTGISRAGGGYAATTIKVETQDLKKLVHDFKTLAYGFNDGASDDTTGAAYLSGALRAANRTYESTVDAATKLGQSEKSIENQQEFLKKVTANIDTGVGAMVDADMEAEAARLQALQVQQQLATQSLSIANQGPQNLLSLFR